MMERFGFSTQFNYKFMKLKFTRVTIMVDHSLHK